MTRFVTPPAALRAHLLTALLALSACTSPPGGPVMPVGVPGALPASVQLGPRPFYLLDQLGAGPLKQALEECAAGTPVWPRSEFSIGHRGAPLQFPEHTREAYLAAARMGAGVLECDVAFTRDRQLVCRHSQNDLHTTTDILATPLAARCHKPFTPARFGSDGQLTQPAAAECRTSDITLAEFRTLRGKMDAFDPRARTVAEYMNGTARWRTDLYAGSGTLMTHRESIALFRQLGVKMTPELKTPVVALPYQGMTREALASQLIADYVDAGVPASQVFPQSFELDVVLHWVRQHPEFGRQAVLLDAASRPQALPDAARLAWLKSQGVNIVAPALFALVALDEQQRIVPSAYARDARAAGLQLIGWSLERSGLVAGGKGGFFFQTVAPAMQTEGDVLRVLDVLLRDVGVRGVFSDWPATTTFMAHCRKPAAP